MRWAVRLALVGLKSNTTTSFVIGLNWKRILAPDIKVFLNGNT
jgi:hypothetical protein